MLSLAIFEKLGFKEGCNVETILATINNDHLINLAPMGITRHNDKLEIRPYKDSNTYKNLKLGSIACINITSDPRLYLQTAFKNIKFLDFPKPQNNGLRLTHAEAHIMVEVVDLKHPSDFYSKATCEINSVEVLHTYPKVFSRGNAEAIEAIIRATRVQTFAYQDLKKFELAVKQFYESKTIVEKVSSPNSVEFRVLKELSVLVDNWRLQA